MLVHLILLPLLRFVSYTADDIVDISALGVSETSRFL